MLKKILSIDNYVFLACAIITALVCYALLGAANITLGVVAVMFTFIIYSAKENNGDYVYTFIWVAIILMGCYVGLELRLSAGFYLFLFAISSYYYITYTKDPFSDRAIPFVVIYASLGTTVKALDYESALSFLIGTGISLLILGIAYKNKVEFTAFKSGLFSKTLYASPKNVMFSSFVYSLFLFMCLYLPDHLGLQRAYWAPMTFVILLKPRDENIIKNTCDRFLGSISGALLVILILNLGFHSHTLNLILVAVCVFLLPTFLKMNSLLKTFALTTFILLLLEFSEFWKDPNYALPDARIYETLIGGSLAVLCSVILKFLRKHSSRFV